jgi:hypothetical protein
MPISGSDLLTEKPPIDPDALQNMQDRKLAFLNAPVDKRTVSTERLQNPASKYIVQAGTVIPAALITGIRSDLPGQVTAQVTVASGVAAAIGDINRFSDPQKLVAYLGLNPSVRQSGEGPAFHGRITKQGRGQARGMLVEAAWAAARSPGPLRAFYKRLAARRGKHIAAVATARKLTMIIWHMLSKEADYFWVRPALVACKFRTVELRAGLPPDHARRGAAYDYNLPARRAQERSVAEKAEAAYADFTSRWRTRPRRTKSVEMDVS